VIRDAFLDAADVAASLLQAPELAARWREPSALEGFSVAGLAFHLASQVLNAPAILAEPSASEALALLDYYTLSTWVASGPGSAANAAIRDRGEEAAADLTPAALVARVEEAVKVLRAAVSEAPADQVVVIRERGLAVDDYLYTRTLELTVHTDDLAVSIGVETPQLPPAAAEATIALLARIAVWRHGSVAVLRALSRSERAPASICAL
jgi:uncharacterized protein (TIGR03083 family)